MSPFASLKTTVLVSLLLVPLSAGAQSPIHHDVFFNLDREGPRQEAFLANPVFEGAQLKFTWRELESEKDRYAFDQLDQALSLLTSRDVVPALRAAH